MISKLSLNLVHVWLKPEQILENPYYYSISQINDSLLINLGQNVYIDIIKDMFESGSSGIKN